MSTESVRPPSARVETRIRVLHEDVTIDRFGWLRDRRGAEARRYLDAENAYASDATGDMASLMSELTAEIQARCLPDCLPPGFDVGQFHYFRRAVRDLPHAAWWRRRVAGGSEELVLNPNALTGSERFFSLGVFEPSDDGRYVAFSFDVVGDEAFELRVRDTTTGRDVWRDSRRSGSVAWAADNQSLFFTQERSDRRQHDRVVRLDVGSGNAAVVFEEADERLDLLVRRSDSGKWIFLDVLGTADYSAAVQRGAAEVWCLPVEQPQAGWRRVVPRDLGREVFAEHSRNEFLLRVDDAGPCGRLVSAPIDEPSPECWKEVVPHRSGITLEEVHVLDEHIVVLEREGMRPRLVVRHHSDEAQATMCPDDPSGTLRVGLSAGGHYSSARHGFQGSQLTYSVSSLVTPETIFEFDLVGGQSSVLFHAMVPGYESADYVARLLMTKADDGMDLPISLVARRDWTSPGPILLYVYGCYGIPIWPSFDPTRLSLIDRGVAFGIVHVRGGGELGRAWHEAAMGQRKRRTYLDLIAAAEGLIGCGVAQRGSIAIQGRSAGGGTVLATAALRPELFRAVLAEVPVADILDTELNFSLPFALRETAEYGDPRLHGDYQYLRSYDPYYNLVEGRKLPPTYVDAALNDGQVLWWQPARYVAQRRQCAGDRDPHLIFRVRLEGGHSGVSHGPDAAKDAAFRMAWTLDQLGLADG